MRVSRNIVISAAALMFVSAASATTVTVNSAVVFNSTGILATAGESFDITATGTADLSDMNGGYVTDPNGTIVTAPASGTGAYDYFYLYGGPVNTAPTVGGQKTIVPVSGATLTPYLFGVPYGALLAGFSTNPVPGLLSDFPSGFQLIGANGIATAPSTGGYLFLAVDDTNPLVDNAGSYTATVTAVTTPEPQAGLLLAGGALSAFALLSRRRLSPRS